MKITLSIFTILFSLLLTFFCRLCLSTITFFAYFSSLFAFVSSSSATSRAVLPFHDFSLLLFFHTIVTGDRRSRVQLLVQDATLGPVRGRTSCSSWGHLKHTMWNTLWRFGLCLNTITNLTFIDTYHPGQSSLSMPSSSMN